MCGINGINIFLSHSIFYIGMQHFRALKIFNMWCVCKIYQIIYLVQIVIVCIYGILVLLLHMLAVENFPWFWENFQKFLTPPNMVSSVVFFCLNCFSSLAR